MAGERGLAAYHLLHDDQTLESSHCRYFIGPTPPPGVGSQLGPRDVQYRAVIRM